jgi:hypothetical protein
VTWRWCCRGQRTARPRASGPARLYKRIHALLAGEQLLGPWQRACTAAGLLERVEQWLLAGQLRLGLAVGLRLAAVWCRGSMPLQSPRDTTRHGAPAGCLCAWTDIAQTLGLAGVVGSKVQCRQSRLSPRLHRSNKWHHDSLIGECLLTLLGNTPTSRTESTLSICLPLPLGNPIVHESIRSPARKP